jgi:hypothetical protein
MQRNSKGTHRFCDSIADHEDSSMSLPASFVNFRVSRIRRPPSALRHLSPPNRNSQDLAGFRSTFLRSINMTVSKCYVAFFEFSRTEAKFFSDQRPTEPINHLQFTLRPPPSVFHPSALNHQPSNSCLLLPCFSVLSVVHLLPSVFCQLSSAFCLLPSVPCLLSPAFCLLPSAFCLLPGMWQSLGIEDSTTRGPGGKFS